MDFKSFIAQGWNDHAADPAGVAQRLHSPGLALVNTADDVAAFATLAHHVYGEHLQGWADGLALLQAAAALPACTPGSSGAGAVARCTASLRLCAGQTDALTGLSASDRVRTLALSAACLAEADSARAAGLFQQAQQDAQHGALPDTDPAHRTLAVTGNGLACTMEEKPARSADERALMIAAAQAARHHWALAGTWLEVERAEYRLAMTWLKAGDAAQALHHAQACLDTVQAHDGAALEQLFAFEALAWAHQALGDSAAQTLAVTQAQAAFEALDLGDRGWCQPTLDRLRQSLPAGPTV